MSDSTVPEEKASYPWQPVQIRPVCCVPEPLFRIEGLSLSYGNKTAFQNLTMEISKGCITALVGPSGCGKTSFLTCLNRLFELIPTVQVSGKMNYRDQDLFNPKWNSLHLRRQIGMIFQKPNPFAMSILKNLTLPLSEHGTKNRDHQMVIVEKVLREVGLWSEVKDRLHSSALALSGGQQQRLCIARALTLSPEVLLMDEPCSALDPLSSGVVEDLITSLRGKYTVVVVTHNLQQARRISDYLAVFWVHQGAGQLIEYGPSSQIFAEPSHPITRDYLRGSRG